MGEDGSNHANEASSDSSIGSFITRINCCSERRFHYVQSIGNHFSPI